jgi:hypothetical protein
MPSAPLQKFICISVSQASHSSAHYVHRCCIRPVSKKKNLFKGLLDNNAYGHTHHDLELRCALHGGCLDLTTFSLHIFDSLALHQRILDSLFVFLKQDGMKTGRIRSGVLGIEGEGLCLRNNLRFFSFAHSRSCSRFGLDHSGHIKTRPADFFGSPPRNL